MSDLRDKRIVVSGATGNMGQALCDALLAEGAEIWAVDRDAAAVEALCARLGSRARGQACDLGDAQAVSRTLDAAGAIWGLVHTVGGFRPGGIAGAPPSDFDAMFDLNARTAFHAIRAALPRMRAAGGGRIVTIASIHAALGSGLAGAALYNASKAAVIALAKAADEEGRDANVRASVLAPATLDTRGNRSAMPDADPSKWVSLSEITSAVLACLHPSSGLGGAVLTLPGRA